MPGEMASTTMHGLCPSLVCILVCTMAVFNGAIRHITENGLPERQKKANKHNSGNSSVGRAQPCQGWGREFEPRFPLQILRPRPLRRGFLLLIVKPLIWLGGRVVMQRTATPCTPVRFRPQPPLLRSPPKICPGGEIGRRKGLKIPRWKHRAGSIPAPGTI